MFRAIALIAACLSLTLLPAPRLAAQGNCEQCHLPPGCRGKGNKKKPKKNCQPLDILVESDLDFGSLVVIGDGVGTVILDLRTGTRIVSGNLDEVGGMAVEGRAVVTGTPNEPVVIDFPTIIAMRDPAGGTAELRDFVTDLDGGAVLDQDGRLEFAFSGTLHTDPSVVRGGTLRGRVTIDVSYP